VTQSRTFLTVEISCHTEYVTSRRDNSSD